MKGTIKEGFGGKLFIRGDDRQKYQFADSDLKGRRLEMYHEDGVRVEFDTRALGRAVDIHAA